MRADRPYNEPAFPIVALSEVQFPGMTLRDNFAAHAFAAICREYTGTSMKWADIAAAAYAAADAMLTARGQ